MVFVEFLEDNIHPLWGLLSVREPFGCTWVQIIEGLGLKAFHGLGVELVD